MILKYSSSFKSFLQKNRIGTDFALPAIKLHFPCCCCWLMPTTEIISSRQSESGAYLPQILEYYLTLYFRTSDDYLITLALHPSLLRINFLKMKNTNLRTFIGYLVDWIVSVRSSRGSPGSVSVAVRMSCHLCCCCCCCCCCLHLGILNC